MVLCADEQTQRAIFGGETVQELLVNESTDSDHAEFWNWKTNPMNAAMIGRFAISLSDAGKQRLLKFIVDRRAWGHGWHYIAKRVDDLRHYERTRESVPRWLLPEAGEYQKRGSSRALIFEIAERLFEQGAAE